MIDIAGRASSKGINSEDDQARDAGEGKAESGWAKWGKKKLDVLRGREEPPGITKSLPET